MTTTTAGRVQQGQTVIFADPRFEGGKVVGQKRERTNLTLWFEDGRWLECSTNMKVEVQ
jgi:hypothetical protein